MARGGDLINAESERIMGMYSTVSFLQQTGKKTREDLIDTNETINAAYQSNYLLIPGGRRVGLQTLSALR